MARPIFAFIFVLFLFCPAFAQTADQTISLKKGFNFISFTVNPSLTPVELKQNNSAIIEDIYLYSATAGSFFNLSEGTLTTIASGKGYILKSLTDATITVNGTPVSVIGNINLKNGFNLIGISKALTNNKFSDAIKNNSVIGGIYKWSPASGSFVQVVRNLSGTADLIDGVDPSFSEGQAYFINIKADTQFNYDGEAIQFGDNIVIRAAKPMFNPNDCSFTSAQQVSITSLTKGATIKYTTDGSVPSSTNGEVYSGPVNVTSTTTIKSIAFKTGIVDSEIASATYTKSIMPTVPTIALDLGRGVKLEMVKISAAGKSFQMGSPDTEQDRESDEGPVHTVSFTKDYYIGKYEVTQAQWLEICGKWPGLSPSTTYGAGENYPAYNVSWHDMYIVGGFFEKINALKPGGYYGFRLPTEAEWEYAARGGTQTRFYWGNDSSYSEIGNYVWFYGNSYTTTHPVGQKLPNGFGLYDMPGNVLELCDDWYGSYRSSSAIDPTGSKMGPYCVSRGGCWNHNANYCRSADRERIYSIYDSGNLLGFRVVLADKLMPEQIVETPSIAPGGITFTAAQNVTITCATIGAIIKYTTDGTTPSSMNGTTYSGTFTISSTTTIKAIACKNGMSDSDVASITYVNTSPAGEVLTLSLGGGVTLEMVKIPAAGKSFRMGSPDTEQDHVSSEGPVHNVSFTNDYYIGKYELTQGQWKAIMNGANPSYFKSNDYNPVEQISWENLTNNFIPAINARKLGYGTFRLPTEAEWEYAARCGTETRFYWGDDLSYIQAENYLWFGDNSRSTTHPVGQKLPNAFGLYDMSGNVMEWCIDWYGDYNGLEDRKSVV